ncbi:MAG: putative LINOLEOYL-CoA [Myxococcaceae bacterium]|nr:putative LINOLEOYL-CoA [Myxococcaceae bacterium]
MNLALNHESAPRMTSTLAAPARPDLRLAPDSELERHRKLAEELDALKARIYAELGADDVLHVKRLDRFSRTMEAIGRVLIHVSFEPVGFTAGVVALWVHKQLQATEVGHSALHGAYDKLPGGEAFHSKTFRWDTPIDEASWRQGHNVKHHGNTNVAGRDPDIHFGPVRLTERTPHKLAHYAQLPFTLGVLFPNFGFLMNLHFTGLLDAYADNGQPEGLDFLPDRTFKSRLGAWQRALRKYVPYYALNFGLYPALAGPFFLKVLLGNVLAEVMRDVYSAATIYCGHVGDDVQSFAHGSKAKTRGEWYAMQIEASNDFEVSRPISILCGGLDRQIEHHLFPTLPPERLRQIAPEVRAICERNGLRYKTASWAATLKKSLSHIARLSKSGGVSEVLRSMS